MDIKRAKQEIRNSIEAYLQKDEYGAYMIPSVRQRPILLMGPPGIGKTQIMEQIAQECRIGLVAYTITHHTRQSAVGLPFIQEKVYGGQKYSVTEYTMSEIIASVYEKIERTGQTEGILFIDEINCVSETLAPTMLQFLQCKMFGNQRVPKGWVIVAAGNPPEYNKSVRDFDVVTLDRMKKIDVEENFDVWKEYAYKVGIHPAVISYLDMKRDYFYRIETTVDGKLFATARGWEDLSEFIKVYEKQHKKADREVIHQYIQHWKIAKDFANYLELFEKYKKDYGLEKILQGFYSKEVLGNLKFAPFDERLSVVGLLIGQLGTLFLNCYLTDQYVTKLFDALKRLRAGETLEEVAKKLELLLQEKKKAEILTKTEERIALEVIRTLEQYQLHIKEQHLQGDAAFEAVRSAFQKEVDKREQEIMETAAALDHAFDFMEEAFAQSQEMVVFITELNTNYYSIKFLKEHGCDKYYLYNKGLLFDEQQKEILKQLDDVESELSLGYKQI